jgi:hypothetical protein
MKRALKVQQQPVDGKKSKSLSVVDALEKAEREEATLLQVEQAATTVWTNAASGKPKKAALQAVDSANRATVARRNEVQCLRNLLEDEELANEEGGEDEEAEEAERGGEEEGC